MSLLNTLINRKWAMNEPALTSLIDIVNKVSLNEIDVAKSFHGDSYKNYISDDGKIIKHEAIANLGFSSLENTYTAVRFKNIALIPVIGVVFPRSSSVPMSYGANVKLSTFEKDFKIALQDESIDTIINVYDTPGGDVTGVSETANIIKTGMKTKNIISYVYGMAASAGYWLASASHKIISSNTGEVGSIGVVATYEDNEEYNKKQGIRHIEIVSDLSENKRLDPTTDAGKQQVLSVINDLNKVFINTVAENRKTTFENVHNNYGRGKMFVAESGLQNGMIDEISTLDDLIKSLTNNNGGVNMTLAELKASDKKAYNEIMEKAKQDALENIKQDTLEKEKQDALEKEKQDTLEKIRKDALIEAKKQLLEEEQQKLAESLNGIGNNVGDQDVENTASVKNFIDAATNSMNRKYK